LGVFDIKRAHIELFARSLEQEGKARATVARRLSTVAGFYRYCVEEQLIAVSPAIHVRRPKVSYESNATGLDRNELGMFLVTSRTLRRPGPRIGVSVGVERAPHL
jgi:site-specific recombinase XerD